MLTAIDQDRSNRNQKTGGHDGAKRAAKLRELSSCEETTRGRYGKSGAGARGFTQGGRLMKPNSPSSEVGFFGPDEGKGASNTGPGILGDEVDVLYEGELEVISEEKDVPSLAHPGEAVLVRGAIQPVTFRGQVAPTLRVHPYPPSTKAPGALSARQV